MRRWSARPTAVGVTLATRPLPRPRLAARASASWRRVKSSTSVRISPSPAWLRIQSGSIRYSRASRPTSGPGPSRDVGPASSGNQMPRTCSRSACVHRQALLHAFTTRHRSSGPSIPQRVSCGRSRVRLHAMARPSFRASCRNHGTTASFSHSARPMVSGQRATPRTHVGRRRSSAFSGVAGEAVARSASFSSATSGQSSRVSAWPVCRSRSATVARVQGVRSVAGLVAMVGGAPVVVARPPSRRRWWCSSRSGGGRSTRRPGTARRRRSLRSRR